MRKWSRLGAAAAGLVLVSGASAQTQTFSGVAHGVVVEFKKGAPAGEFRIRVAGTGEHYRFAFDAKTYVERRGGRILMGSVEIGEAVEVIGDRDANAPVHYARIVHVIEAHGMRAQAMSTGRYRLYREPFEPYRSPFEWSAPRGDMTFSGVVAKLGPDRLVLHARAQGEQTILLRLDTRYLAGGELVDRAELKPNTRVFVRAGKNLDDQVEAYQVIWGEILEPGRGH